MQRRIHLSATVLFLCAALAAQAQPATSAIRDIRIDDLPLGTLEGKGITPVGDGTFPVAQVEVTSGAHVITGSEPFGACQYGHGFGDAAYDAYGNGGGQKYRNLRDAGK